jgi:dTDP-4-amino-4,6-dideoxygalactose transaminase
MQGAYADLGLAPEALQLARQLADEVLSLPMGPQLKANQVSRINTIIKISCLRA